MTEPIELPPDLKKDDWRHLKGYGYAPGEYMGTCHRCGETPTMDKRAITCRPCAETMHADEQKRKQEPSAWIIDGDLESLMAEGRRAVLTELNELRAEVDALKRRLGQHDACNGVMGESGYVPECISMRAEVERLRAELARLTTLRPASEWDGETIVLWWREWDVAGWAIASVSDSQDSGYWTPAFDAKESA